MTKRAGYFSYLLRLWRTGDAEEATWRASLEEPGTRQRHGFATLDDLFDFLRRQACLPPGQGAAPADDRATNGQPKDNL